jgi:protein-tyrosine phosphatase
VIRRDPAALTDIHNHLVPGVDDGARDLDDVLTSVEQMTREGIRKIVTTPHLDGSLTQSDARLQERLDEVDEAFARAVRAVGETFPEVDFRRGHEVMLDIPDVDFSDPRVRLAGTRFVLVEWPRLHLPPGTPQVLRRIRDQGYLPIVAHPERYLGVDLSITGQWREAGAYLQVNYGSLDGRYGGDARTFALRLFRRGWVSYLASDFHGRPDRKLYRAEVWNRLEGLDGDEMLTHLCVTNPARVLQGEEPLPVPMLPPEHGFWAKVRGMLKQEPA